jgi:hydrogenase maturation protein HypF
MAGPSATRRVAIEIRGIVQGVGFRPFVYNAARAESLTGWVRNDVASVRIEAQGPSVHLSRFIKVLKEQYPPQARIDSFAVEDVALADFDNESSFSIASSSGGKASPHPIIPADLATCQAGLDEITDVGERRFRYPFTNCTNCGPRWSIIRDLPYDRPRTSMSDFHMCDTCLREYQDPTDRRFHAQPIACPACGPSLQWLAPDGKQLAVDDEALLAAVAAVTAGMIVAIKGLGGFQLVVDATDEQAVRRLRIRKHRPDKPLAVMVLDLNDARASCEISEEEASLLASHQAPIVLLRRKQKATSGTVAEAVAPGNPYLGTMLPYTPLHHVLLRDVARPIVCTSGNRSEEPMATSTEEAIARLGDIADMILTHDRPIVRPVDDSVARVIGGQPQVLRRARGYAPQPVTLLRRPPSTLAVGGHLKNTVALSVGPDVVISPHIGDLDDALSLDVHRRAITDLVEFFRVTPEIIVCDLHPDYASTIHAERLAEQWGVPLLRIQHHHAHVLSLMAENRLDEPVLGLAWDGTGYGLDGTVWGGEALLCDGAQFERVAHLRSFSLPGGDRAAREPRRSALGLLFEIKGPACRELVQSMFTASELEMLLSAMENPRLFPRTSSMGRLFDAVAALAELSWRVSFEGQAAMELEFAAVDQELPPYEIELTDEQPAQWNWEPMLDQMLNDLRGSQTRSVVATRFHESLALAAVQIAERCQCPRVGLTGGCFQNDQLRRRVHMRLSAAGFDVYTQYHVPPGDGGIALGQIWAAALMKGR